MCCSDAKWQREEVPDHKFDFIDVTEFRSKACGTRLQFFWLYALVIKSFIVYVFDAYTAILLLASNKWSGSIIANAGAKSIVRVPFEIGKWVFFGCIILSFLLLMWEARKAKAIIKSRDISYAFTNVMANNYYSMKSYDYFCFFSQINNSTKKKDEFAFFIFFTFKGWKRLVFADAPRQVINGLTLYSFGVANDFTTDIEQYIRDENGQTSFLQATVLGTMLFTVVVFIGSALLLLTAVIFYIPLLCYIRGNLKEYCCHKVDKRIAELMKRKARKRLAKEAALAKKEAQGDFSHLKDKNGNMIAAPLPQPTLPNIGLDDAELYDDTKSDYGSGYGSNYGRSRAVMPVGERPNPAAQWANAQSQQHNLNGYHTYDRPVQVASNHQPQPSYGTRNGYPYAPSEADSLGYEPSVASIEPLNKKMYDEKAGQSQSSLNRAPSYRSDWSGYNAAVSGMDKETVAAYEGLAQAPYASQYYAAGGSTIGGSQVGRRNSGGASERWRDSSFHGSEASYRSNGMGGTRNPGGVGQGGGYWMPQGQGMGTGSTTDYRR